MLWLLNVGVSRATNKTPKNCYGCPLPMPCVGALKCEFHRIVKCQQMFFFLLLLFLDFYQGLKTVRNSSLLVSHRKIQAGQVYPFGYSWSTPTLGDLPSLPSCELFPDLKHRLRQKWEPTCSTLEILSLTCTSQTEKEAVKVETYELRVVGLSTLRVLIGKSFQKGGAIGKTKMWGWGVILI